MSNDGELRPLFHSNIRGHWQAVETGMTGGGVPDSNYCVESSEGWVEFKQTHAWAVGVRPAQVGWIEQRLRNGGRVWIGVRRWKTHEKKDELWILWGAAIRKLSTSGLRGVDPTHVRRVLHGGPSSWDWDSVRRDLQTYGDNQLV